MIRVCLSLYLGMVGACGEAPRYTTIHGIEVYGDGEAPIPPQDAVELITSAVLLHFSGPNHKFRKYLKDATQIMFTPGEPVDYPLKDAEGRVVGSRTIYALPCPTDPTTWCAGWNAGSSDKSDVLVIWRPEICLGESALSHELLHVWQWATDIYPEVGTGEDDPELFMWACRDNPDCYDATAELQIRNRTKAILCQAP